MTFSLQLNQRTLSGLLIALALLVSATMIFIATQWYDDWKLAHQPPPTTSQPTADANARLIKQIPDLHLFGQDITATGNMPITNLQLRVTGIVREENASKEKVSKAYISISGGPGKIYQVGDSLPDGVRIYEITPDTVILENGGRLEKLPLPREHLEFKPRTTEENY